ncbi:MAG: cation:proton antiporter [Lachnospiraceae bacterium]|jgi:multisubunit Na+/H+ antiporter MnhF subunit|nr:cation:proton antiporter [Lachnospiraceae bacterium]MBQ2627555.1 cation:proton antiporter [Eubacterium sp.]MBQ6364488.1 cation:proton antiporter [Lachnospiraceae bacterium]MBR2996405.1 cation:proton antiporter [Lachnospiraceae bacterium]
MTALLIGAIIYVILDFALLYRIFRGPTAADRMCAADALDLTTATALVMYALYTGRAIYLDVGLVVALLGFVGTVFVSRYLEGRI